MLTLFKIQIGNAERLRDTTPVTRWMHPLLFQHESSVQIGRVVAPGYRFKREDEGVEWIVGVHDAACDAVKAMKVNRALRAGWFER